MKARMAVALGFAMIFASAASAQTSLVNDNFDGYADQAAFEAVWVPIGGGSPPGSLGVIGGTLSTEQAVSGTFSVKNQSPPAFVPPEPTTSAYSQRNQLIFTESGDISPTLGVRFSFDFYDLTGTGNPHRQSVNLQDSVAPGSSNQLVSMGLNNNQLGADSGGNFYMARILGYSNPIIDPDGGPDEKLAATNYVKLNDFVDSPLRSLGWHNLKVEITTDDGLSTDYKFYVDGILAEKVDNVGTTVRSYDVLRMGAGVSSVTDGYYDNMVVETFVPGGPSVTGPDFNDDGFVNGEDFLIWQANYGATGTGTQPTGDASDPADGNVNDADFAIWAAQFGSPASVGAASGVPEPASAALAAVALAGLAAARRRPVC